MDEAVEERLRAEPVVWFATTHPDGRPHLTPIWFVWLDGRLWVCCADDAVKARNVRAFPKVSFALADGMRPVVGEGPAEVLDAPGPDAVQAAFLAKYGWDLATDPGYGTLIAVTPVRWPMVAS